MKKNIVLFILIFISFYSTSLVFGQEVSDEAQRHSDRGVAAIDIKDFEAAIKEFEEAVKLAPDWPDAFYNLGAAQEGAEKYRDAVRSYTEYLRLAPNADDAEDIKSLINTLEFKAEQVLTIPDIVDTLVSCNEKGGWQEFDSDSGILKPLGANGGLGLDITRVDDRSVKVLTERRRYLDREEYSYSTLSVTGPVIAYTHKLFMLNNKTKELDYKAYADIEIEVVSKNHVKIHRISHNFGFSNLDVDSLYEYKKKDGSPNAENIDRNAPADINAKDSSGYTPLIGAILRRNKDDIDSLIAKGADVTARDNRQRTPLHVAVVWGKMEVVELLIAKGADINAKEEDGTTPLHEAATWDNTKIAELFIAKGAQINVRDNDGWTPLLTAASGKSGEETAMLLIAKGADVNAKDNEGITTLHLAAEYGKKELAELLIAKGADVNANDNEGKTPLQIAESKGFKEVADLLRKHGAR
jgi:ankyrin repeat protein